MNNMRLTEQIQNKENENEIYIGKRIKRGLFRAKNRLVNADVNGSYNILRKAVPNAFTGYGIEGIVGYPYSVPVTELKIW